MDITDGYLGWSPDCLVSDRRSAMDSFARITVAGCRACGNLLQSLIGVGYHGLVNKARQQLVQLLLFSVTTIEVTRLSDTLPSSAL